jgi:hypothetical protein
MLISLEPSVRRGALLSIGLSSRTHRLAWFRRHSPTIADHHNRAMPAHPARGNHEVLPGWDGEQNGHEVMDEATGSVCYEIRVRGLLGSTLLGAFPDLHAQADGRETVLTGRLADQAALYGLLAQLESLGLELLEVRRAPC